MSRDSRFAWWAVTIFAVSVVSVVALNIFRSLDLIDNQLEGLLRVLIIGILGTILIVLCCYAPISRPFRFTILLTVGVAFTDTILDFTEDVPGLNATPIIGRASQVRPFIESVLGAGWLCGAFGLMYLALMSVQQWRQEATQKIEELRTSKDNLKQSNEKLSSTLEELERTQEQLVQQERLSALGQIASGVAHDLNNTLVPVVAYSRQLAMSQPDLSDDQKVWVDCIEQGALDAAAALRGLQYFFGGNTHPPARETVIPAQLVNQVVEMTRAKWKDELERRGRKITLETRLADCREIHVNAAEIRLVLTNLIFNAVDAMPEGGVLTIQLHNRDQQAVLSVSDTGEGMSDEVKRLCFDPFYGHKPNGTGLGLSVCQGIVERHDGHLDVESKPGNGSTFCVRLPTADVPCTKSAPVPLPKQDEESQLRILLVDDDDAVRAAVGSQLQILGADVVLATDGQAGISAFRDQRPFDWVITDLGMAGMDGADVVRAIRAEEPEQQIAVQTGWTEAEVQSRFPDGDCPEFVIQKPDLEGQLSELFRRHRSLSGRRR